MAAVAATAGRTTRRGSLDADPLLHSHLGLGYHPGLGFKSTTAAARFSAVDLDDTLEEELDWDMAAGEPLPGLSPDLTHAWPGGI